MNVESERQTVSDEGGDEGRSLAASVVASLSLPSSPITLLPAVWFGLTSFALSPLVSPVKPGPTGSRHEVRKDWSEDDNGFHFLSLPIPFSICHHYRYHIFHSRFLPVPIPFPPVPFTVRLCRSFGSLHVRNGNEM